MKLIIDIPDTAVILRWIYKCSKCGYVVQSKCHICPNCGEKMIEPQEGANE